MITLQPPLMGRHLGMSCAVVGIEPGRPSGFDPTGDRAVILVAPDQQGVFRVVSLATVEILNVHYGNVDGGTNAAEILNRAIGWTGGTRFPEEAKR